MKRSALLAIAFLMVFITACGNGNDIKTDEAEANNENESEYIHLIERTALMNAKLYLERGQGTVPKELRDKTADTIIESISKSSGNTDFYELAELIREDNYDRALELFVELNSSGGYAVELESINNRQPSEHEDQDVSSDRLMNVIVQLNRNVVNEKILEIATEDWPDDASMQDYVIKKQTEAYNELVNLNIDIPEKELTLNAAFEKWDYDFDMVLYEYEKQMDAYEALVSLPDEAPVSEILQSAFEKWETDYDMVLYEYEKQMDAYELIMSLSEEGETISEILQYAFEKWETDYDMVLYEFEKQLEALLVIGQIIESEQFDTEKLEAAILKWGQDYDMVLYEYEK